MSFCKHIIYNYLCCSFSLIMSVRDNTVIDTFWQCCGCPSCLKWCSDNWDNHMKTLPRWLHMTRMTETISIDRLDRVEFYPDDWKDREKFWSDLEMLSDDWDHKDDWSLFQKSSLPSINSENYIFALDTAEVENNSKMFASRMRVIGN